LREFFGAKPLALGRHLVYRFSFQEFHRDHVAKHFETIEVAQASARYGSVLIYKDERP
jgi:hypothetical protein